MPPDDVRQTAPSASLSPSGRELVITRPFDVARSVLFRAWTAPEQLARWWGPEGFTIPVARNDLRAGGAYRLVMRSPEGTDYPLKGIYQEIVEPERLVMSVDLHDHPGEWHALLNEYRQDHAGRFSPEMVLEADFEARDDGTLLTVRLRFSSRTELHAMLKTGMAAGWAQSLDRLARFLSGEQEPPPS